MKDSNKSRKSRKSAGTPTPATPPTPGKQGGWKDDDKLSFHKGNGRWCKRVKGRVVYFEKLEDDPDGTLSLEEWKRDRDGYKAGREPRGAVAVAGAYTIEDLCEDYIAHQEERRNNREIADRTFHGMAATCRLILSTFAKWRAVSDLTPDDFRQLKAEICKSRIAANSQRNEMQRCRSLFKFAHDDGKIPAAVTFGKGFEKPSADKVDDEREDHREAHGDKMFEAHEIRAILSKCSQPLKSMVLLGMNCGFGASDLSALPLRVLDLDNQLIENFARVKTRVRRKRIPLWPETVESIREWLKERPKAKDPADAGLLFLTVRGQRWVKVCSTGAPSDAIGQEFGKVLKELKIKRPKLGFYGLRHGFETIGGETADQIAVDAIMGHKTPGMASNYIERISDDRKRRVVEHIRAWLFGSDDSPEGDSRPLFRKETEISDPCGPRDPAHENKGFSNDSAAAPVRPPVDSSATPDENSPETAATVSPRFPFRIVG